MNSAEENIRLWFGQLPDKFTVNEAATLWGISRNGADSRVRAIRRKHLIEVEKPTFHPGKGSSVAAVYRKV